MNTPVLAKIYAEQYRRNREDFEPMRLFAAIAHDGMVPVALFAAWASVQKFRQWRDEGRLGVRVLNSRCCVKPSEFFAFFDSLPDRSPPNNLTASLSKTKAAKSILPANKPKQIRKPNE